MRVGSGRHEYDWIDGWAQAPATTAAHVGWAHHGITVSGAGDIIAVAPSDATVLVFDANGALRQSFATGLTEGHGLTLVAEGDTEYLWIADHGVKRQPALGYELPAGLGGRPGRVVKMTLAGAHVFELPLPPAAATPGARYLPTSVAVNEDRFGGNGDIWVSDGYGESLVHRFDRHGRHRATLTGEEGRGGRFSTPHNVVIDRRKPEPELYISDRGNRRLQVYDLDGGFKRVVGEGTLTSPGGWVADGEFMILSELHARLVVLDAADRFVCELGANASACDRDGWPNARGDDGRLRRPPLEMGRFNSPHAIAIDASGSLYIGEWLIGGRITKLARA